MTGDWKPLDIPEEINLYNEYKRATKEAPGEEGESARLALRALEQTFRDFNIPENKWSGMGNLVLRFSHLMGEQDEPVQIDEDADKAVHFIADLYEHYNEVFHQLYESSQQAQDGQHRLGNPFFKGQ